MSPSEHSDPPEDSISEEELHRAVYRSIFDSAAIGMCLCDDAGRLLRVNPRLGAILGYSRDDLVGMSLGGLTQPGDPQPDSKSLDALLSGEKTSHTMETRWIRADGEPCWISLTLSLLSREPGKPTHFIAAVEDVSGRVRSQQALAQAYDNLAAATVELEMFRRLAEAAGQGIGMARLDGTLRYLNPSLRHLLGVSEDAEPGAYSLFDFHTREQGIQLKDNILPALLEAGSWTGEMGVRALDGRIVPVIHSLFLIRDPEGMPLALGNVVTDLTESRLMTESLEQERNFVDAILDHAGALVVVLDREGRIRRFNRACEALTGKSFEQVEGECVWDHFLPPEEIGDVRDNAFRALAEHPDQLHGTHTNHWLSKTGERRLIVWSNSLLLDRHGHTEFMVAIGTDVTEQRRIEDALKRSEDTYARAESIAHIGSWDWDITTNGLRWSDEIYRIFGQVPQSFGASYPAFLETIHPDDRQRVTDAVNQALADPETPYTLEHRVVRPDGTLRVVYERGQVYRDGEGRPVRMIGSVQDITERKETEAVLKRQAQVIDQIHDSVVSTDLEGNITGWNKGAERIFGYGAAEVMGRPISLVYPEDQREVLDEQVIAPLKTKGLHEVEVTMRRKSGERFYGHLSLALQQDDEGRPFGMIGYTIDITDRRHAEEEAGRLASIVRNSPDFIGISDIEGNAVFLNEAGRALVETPQGAPGDGAKIKDFFPESEQALLTDHILPTVMSDGGWIGETLFRNFRTGQPIPVWCDIFRIDDPATGQPLRLATVSRDISEKKRLDEELGRYREHLEDLVRARTVQLEAAQRIGHMGNWNWDVASGRITWSDEIFRIFGYRPGEFEPTYQHFLSTVHPEDMEAVKRSEQKAFSAGQRHSIDHRILLPDGEVRWVHEEAVATLDASGKPCALSGTVQDITQRKLAEASLVRAKEEAERANRAKTEFLGRMSHELRTPMNAILGFAQLLESEPLDAEQLDFVCEIHRAGDHLLELIDELLDLARIEAGRLSVLIVPVAAAPLVDQAVQMVKPLLAREEIRLSVECTDDLAVLADATRLKQILVNLLSNAAKYNRKGGSIRIACHPGENDTIRLSVSDSGSGIEENKLPHLFQPFERLGAEFSAVEGAGIGLALSKRLAEMMGGRLSVESTPGRGSRFSIELPAAAAETAVQPPPRVPEEGNARQRHRVLYVEDNAANLKLVESLLRRRPGLSMLSAANGRYGLELARKHLPDVILLDIHLPDMDGYAILQALQDDPATRRIPVVALSADAMPLDVERGLAAGFRDYLSKPLKVAKLVDTIDRLLRESGP